jgi:hypothetical protein
MAELVLPILAGYGCVSVSTARARYTPRHVSEGGRQLWGGSKVKLMARAGRSQIWSGIECDFLSAIIFITSLQDVSPPRCGHPAWRDYTYVLRRHPVPKTTRCYMVSVLDTDGLFANFEPETAHINKQPSVKHDLAPSTAADKKERVELDPDGGIDDASDVGEDEISTRVLRPVARRPQMPPLPDLR